MKNSEIREWLISIYIVFKWIILGTIGILAGIGIIIFSNTYPKLSFSILIGLIILLWIIVTKRSRKNK